MMQGSGICSLPIRFKAKTGSWAWQCHQCVLEDESGTWPNQEILSGAPSDLPYRSTYSLTVWPKRGSET